MAQTNHSPNNGGTAPSVLVPIIETALDAAGVGIDPTLASIVAVLVAAGLVRGIGWTIHRFRTRWLNDSNHAEPGDV